MGGILITFYLSISMASKDRMDRCLQIGNQEARFDVMCALGGNDTVT